MKQIKFEVKKIFLNKFFLGFLAFAICLNVFVLYENYKSNSVSVGVQTYSTYGEYLKTVKTNAENANSVSVFNDTLTEFSKKNIEKTAKAFEKMQGVEITEDVNDGVLAVLDSGISDFCILLLLVSVGLSLIIDEKEKHLYHLIRSTRNGTSAIGAKLASLLICSAFINLMITASTVITASELYGFGDINRSIQSVPDMLSSILRLNVFEFFILNFAVKTVGVFIIGMLIVLLCLLTKRAITMLISVVLIGAVNVLLTYIPDTSKFNFFKFINFYSLINPYHIFRSYVNLNIFGEPVNLIFVFTIFSLVIAALLVLVNILYFSKKRPLENSAGKSRGMASISRVHNSLVYFELKKLLSLNKAVVIILIFALFQTYAVCNQESFKSKEEQYYKQYMQMLEGQLDEQKEKLILDEKKRFDDAQKQLDILNAQRQNKEISMQEFIAKQEKYSDVIEMSEVFQRVYDRYLYIKQNPEAQFVYDTGYEKLFGISDPDFSLKNTILLLCAFALCFCSVYSIEYKSGMNKILCNVKYGGKKTRKVKYLVMFCLTALLFFIAHIPEMIYVGRFYGFSCLTCKLLCIPALSHFGGLPIWSGIALLYLTRFVAVSALIPVISAMSLKLKNNIKTAVLFVLLFVPLYVFGFSAI